MRLLRKPFPLLPFVLLATLSGCAVRQVSLVRAVPMAQVEPGYAATDNLYVLIERPTFAIAGRTAEGWTEDSRGAAESYELGRALSREIARRRGRVAAFRVQDQVKVDDGFIDQMNPSAVLLVRGRGLAQKAEKTGAREEVVQMQGGKKEKRTVEIWTVTKSAGCEIRLVGYPDQKLLFERALDQTAQTTCENCGGVISPENEATLDKTILTSLAASAAAAIRPVTFVTNVRPLPFQKEAPLSKDAAQAAGRDNWALAQEKWDARLKEDPADWKAAFGLGLAAERREDLAQAAQWYGRAQALSVRSSEAKKIDFSGLLASLTAGTAWPPRPAAANIWFDKRVAVLPFSDEVVSLDGPDFARQMFHDQLAASGYNVIPLSEIDDTLRAHGFSEGGQLTATRPAKLAAWLKADRLIYGHVDKFDDQNVGVYRNRAVHADLRMWDAGRQDDIWTSGRAAGTKIVTNNVAAGFIGGLLGSWAERSRGKPLAPEVARFTLLNLETLPLRVPE